MSIGSLIERSLYGVWKFILKWSFYLFSIVPINRNKIVFSNYVGKGFGDNPKYIALKLHERMPNANLYWILKKGIVDDLPKWIKPVRLGSLQCAYIYATSFVWVDNARKPRYVRKRKHQYYIQTWHGGFVLKAVEKDAELTLPRSWIETSKHDSAMIDCMVSDSRECTSMYRRAFWYSGKIIECGYPRDDVLFDINAAKKKVCDALGISFDSKLFIYAPTFRDSGNWSSNLNFIVVLNALEKRFGGKWVALVRFHPLDSHNRSLVSSSKNVVNCTDYPDMYELLAASDVEITDYSSSVFEFACLQHKPAFLYADDVEQYERERGFRLDIKSLPFSLASRNEDLENLILEFDENDYLERLNLFNDNVGWFSDGHASERVVEIITRLMMYSQLKYKHYMHFKK